MNGYFRHSLSPFLLGFLFDVILVNLCVKAVVVCHVELLFCLFKFPRKVHEQNMHKAHIVGNGCGEGCGFGIRCRENVLMDDFEPQFTDFERHLHH